MPRRQRNGLTQMRSSANSGRCAGKVRGATGARDDDAETARLGGGGVLKQQVGCAVCGDNLHFVRYAERDKRIDGVLHGVPVGAGSHDDANEWRWARGFGHLSTRKRSEDKEFRGLAPANRYGGLRPP